MHDWSEFSSVTWVMYKWWQWDGVVINTAATNLGSVYITVVVIMMRPFEDNEWVRAHFMDRLHICISKRSHRWGNLQKSLWYRAGCIFTLSFLFYLGTEGETWMVWSLFILKLKLRQIFGRGKKWMVDHWGKLGLFCSISIFAKVPPRANNWYLRWFVFKKKVGNKKS